jgi:hypothetical protein
MLVGNIFTALVKFRNSKNSYFINIKSMFLKLWHFKNFNKVFQVLVLVFDFNEFLEGVLHGNCHSLQLSCSFICSIACLFIHLLVFCSATNLLNHYLFIPSHPIHSFAEPHIHSAISSF